MKLKHIAKKMISGAMAFTMILSMSCNVSAAGTTDAATLKSQIEVARAELEAAKTEQAARQTQYNRGLLGFIEWMDTKPNLTTIQKNDLKKGKEVLQAAIEEDFSKWYGGTNTGLPASRNNKVVVIGDHYDAIALDNLQYGIDQMKKINELRATDPNYVGVMKRNPGRTNFYMMAVATSGANRGAGLQRHSLLQVSCENLSFGGNPAIMWYSEKSIFDKYKQDLNITTLTSDSDVKCIDEAASADNKVVGHYTNLFWSIDQLMGVGYTNYKGTGCFNASKLSNYSSSYATYSIEEFEAIYKDYMAYINPAVYQKKVDDAQTKLNGLLEQYYGTCTGHTYGTTKTVEATCTEKGYTTKTCTKCGYELLTYTAEALGHDLVEGVCSRCGKTTPISLRYVWWRLGNKSSSIVNQTYQVGDVVEISIDYTSASEDKYQDEFRIDISDPKVMSYEPGQFNKGKMTMLQQGDCTVTVTSVDNPELSKVFNIEVTEVGGHNYTISADSDGDGKTTKTCSNCGKKVEVLVPTAITRVVFWKDGSGTYSPITYEENTEIELEVRYSPGTVNNYEFEAEIENPAIASYTKGKRDNYINLKLLKPGTTTIKVYAKYNPQAYKTYTLEVTETGGHIWKDPTYIWDATKDTYVAKFVCQNDSTHVKTVDCVMYEQSRISATCDTAGQITYGIRSYTFDGRQYSPSTIKTKSIPATGHTWRTPTYTWDATKGTYVAKFTCSRNYLHTESVDCVMYEKSRVAATCEASGSITYGIKPYTFAGTQYSPTNVKTTSIAATGHAWGEPTYTWDATKNTYVAKFTCKNSSSHTQSVDCVMYEKSRVAATCDTAGSITYGIKTYTFNGKQYTPTNVKTTSIAATGHAWGEPTYTWSDSKNTYVAKFTCKNSSSHTQSVDCVMEEKSRVAATCDTAGSITYGIKPYTFAGKQYAPTTVKTKTLAATGHAWGEPTYTWSDSKNTYVAKFTCKNSSSHTQSVDCVMYEKSRVAATCDTAGSITYGIKSYTFNGKQYAPTNVKTTSIAATGHKWATPNYTWSEDGKTCNVKIVCQNNKTHTKTFDKQSVQEKYVAPTEAKDGSATYRVTVEYEGYKFTDTKTVVLNKTGGTGLPKVDVYYITHVQTYGWQGDRNNYKTWKKNGEMAGTSGEAKRLESIQIKLDTTAKLGVEYRTHIQTYGWESKYKANGDMSGTSGEAKRLEAISIRLTGEDKDKYDIYYRVHAQTYGWLGWAKNGQNAGTAAQAKRLEGIQILVLPKGQKPSEGTVGYSYIELGKASANNDSAGMINYMTHVQTYGDQKYVYDGSVSGTFGESKRLEGIRIKLNPEKTGYSGSVQYQTQVQTYGWRPWSQDGEMNGTYGQAKRLEAIRIKLTGEIALHYDVYYRVHSQTYSWLGWAKNGETAGTVGLAKRLEGIQIVLVPKGQGAPNYLPGLPGLQSYIAK